MSAWRSVGRLALVCGLLFGVSEEAGAAPRRRPVTAPSEPPVEAPPVTDFGEPGAGEPAGLPGATVSCPYGQMIQDARSLTERVKTLEREVDVQRRRAGADVSALQAELTRLRREAAERLREAKQYAASPAGIEDNRQCLREMFDRAEQSLSVGVVEDLVQAFGQVVVNRATRSAYRMLSKRLQEHAHCGAPATPDSLRLPETCRVLDARLQDLLANPRSLVDAALTDLLRLTRPLLTRPRMGSFERSLVHRVDDAILGWQTNGLPGATNALLARYFVYVTELGALSTCPSSLPDAALWATGQCLLEVGKPARFLTCDLDRILAATDLTRAEQERVRGVVLGGAKAMNSLGELRETGVSYALAREQANLLFELAKLAHPEVDAPPGAREGPRQPSSGAHWEAYQDVFIGVYDEDWPRVTRGALGLVDALASDGEAREGLCRARTNAPCPKDMSEALRDDTRAFYSFLVGVAQYAATYQRAGDPAEARAAVLDELVDRLTNRSERRGVVGSIGGSLAIVGAARMPAQGAFSSPTVSFPLHLGLGLGLDTYPRSKARDGGFHGEVTFVDLGQYVSFETASLSVQKPDLLAALALGIKLGAWFYNREAPLYLAAYASVSPFVRAAGDAGDTVMTWQLGAVFGIYVPFYDFN
ncbi:MAG: hypothetical protein KC636_03745 [Myxococcales bacterium]|nr:hypothetical protein [Myxococcales bacterium]